MASIYNSNYVTEYNDSGFITQFSSISTQAIASYAQSNQSTTDLLIGSSSNVIVQSKQGIQMYVTDSNTISFFMTDTYGSNIRPMLSITNSNDTTILSGSNLIFDLSGSNNIGSFATSNIMLFQGDSGSGSGTIGSGSNSNMINYATTNLGGFGFQNNVNVSSNLIVQGNITAYENIACAGNLFGSTFNIFTNTPNCNVTPNIQRVSYSFFINHYNQLDLLRTDQLLSNNQIASKVQRIMTFGNTEFKNQLKDNPDYYQVVSQFSGVNGDYSNGATSWITDVKWMPACGSYNICYTKGNVGIGTNNPLSALHVLGDLTIKGHIIPSDNILYDVGTSNKRFRNLYLSGNSIFLGNSKLTVDNNGSLNYLNPSGQTINLTSNISVNSTAIATSNITYPMSNLAYPLSATVGVLSNLAYPLSATVGVLSNLAYPLSATVVETSNMAYNMSNIVKEISNKMAIKAASDIIAINNTPTTILTLNPTNQGKFYELYIGPTIFGCPYFAKANVFWNSMDNSAYINMVSSNNGLTLTNNGADILIHTLEKIYGPRHPVIDITTNIGSLYIASARTNNIDAFKSFNKTVVNGWHGDDNIYNSSTGLVNEEPDWLQIQIIPPIQIKSYLIQPESDGAPTSWTITASSDNGETWTEIDNKVDVQLTLNATEFEITTTELPTFSIYRITINKILSGTSAYIKYFAITENSLLKYPLALYKL